MFELRIDLSQIRQLADDLGVARDQIPFAAARVMNDAAFITRDALVHDTWPWKSSSRSDSLKGLFARSKLKCVR
jgi:hypothetical protein